MFMVPQGKMFRAPNLITFQAIPSINFQIVKLLQSDGADQQIEAHSALIFRQLWEAACRV